MCVYNKSLLLLLTRHTNDVTQRERFVHSLIKLIGTHGVKIKCVSKELMIVVVVAVVMNQQIFY